MDKARKKELFKGYKAKEKENFKDKIEKNRKNTQAFMKKTGDSERKLKELLKNLQIGRMFILFSGMGKIK